MRISLVSSFKEERFSQSVANNEDTELLNFLSQKGLDVTETVWNDENVDWNLYDVAIIKSPWDYHNNLEKFILWLDSINDIGVKIINPIEVIKWNSDKHYLGEIQKIGLPVVPLKFLHKGTIFDISFFERFGTDKLVVKPCVSAGAQNTIIVRKEDFASQQHNVNALLQHEDFIVQPFVKEISNGEWSFIFFNSKYSHAILKIPKEGDFRVQHQHGGSISNTTPSENLIAQASVFLRGLPHKTLYARVDGVEINGVFKLMELELIEPYLFLNNNHLLLETYYKALMELIG